MLTPKRRESSWLWTWAVLARRLGLFQVDRKQGIRPTVTVIEGEGPFVNILFQVKEGENKRLLQTHWDLMRVVVEVSGGMQTWLEKRLRK